jgi:hypothetical protein
VVRSVSGRAGKTVHGVFTVVMMSLDWNRGVSHAPHAKAISCGVRASDMMKGLLRTKSFAS